MIDLEQALGLIGESVAALGAESVRLELAAGRVLRQRVVADRDFPPTHRSAMDGYAVRAADLADGQATLEIAGELRAGQTADGVRLRAGQAVRIMTGAVVPEGADAVVMVERSQETDDARRVSLRDTPRPWSNVRRRGEDLSTGTTVLEPGCVIGPAEIAALASVGADPVNVTRRPVARVLSTGDEVIAPASRPMPHQVRNSNAPMLAAWLSRCGAEVAESSTVRDDPAALDAALERALRSDLLLISGGVSVGRYDLVADALQRAGVDTLFHGVAIKPGKPLLAGVGTTREGGARCLVLGLPGNPLSAFAGFVLVGASALRRMSGVEPWRAVSIRARLAVPLEARPGRHTFHLARLTLGERGLQAEPVANRGSGDVLSLARANGFVVTDEQGGRFESGAAVSAIAWADLALVADQMQDAGA